MRLRTQLVVATLLIIGLLTGALLLIVRQTVRAEIASQVRESAVASLGAFERVQHEHEIDLSRTAALLAELPTLKALMTTRDRITIQDASEPFWKLAGSDLFLLASPEREVLGFHIVSPAWTPEDAARALNGSPEPGEDAAWWYADGQLYRVFLRPITAGNGDQERQLGLLAVGYQVNSSVAQQLAVVAGSQIVLTAGDRIIASTLPPEQTAELRRLALDARFRAGSQTQEITLGKDEYEAAPVLIHDGPPAPIQSYVFLSMKAANSFSQRLNGVIFLLGASAFAFAAVLLGFVARTITRPLEDLVAGVGALAMGDYSYSIAPRGSSEVAELAEAFSKMRHDLVVAQEKRLAVERVAALGRAARSISHDLRHYLAAVLANAEFLYESDRLRLDKDEIYDEIRTASNQMVDLLDSLRELAREGPAISPIVANLEQTARRAVEAVLANPESRGRSISITVSGEMEGLFDPKKIERALMNLLLNACEATHPGEGRVDVEILSSPEAFSIRIKDNGRGIPASIRGTLFDPFVSSDKINGTGLGLAIVDKIIHDHRGTVQVERTSDVGTVFLITLPRTPRAMASRPAPVAH